MAMMEDPYYGVKDDIEAGLQTLNRQVAQWQRLTATPASPPQITASADEIRNTLGTIEMDLNDLEDTVRIVEANPTRFHLTTAEVQERRRFIAQARQALQQRRALLKAGGGAGGAMGGAAQPPIQRSAAVTSPTTTGRPALMGGGPGVGRSADVEDPSRAALFGASGKGGSYHAYQGLEAPLPAETNAAFMDREQQQQQQLMRRQDDQLDQVMHTVGNMKEVAYVIGRELEDQAVLLDDLEVKVDSASGKLQLGMNRMRDFIKSNSDTKQQWTIICLIIVLIILIILVIYI